MKFLFTLCSVNPSLHDSHFSPSCVAEHFTIKSFLFLNFTLYCSVWHNTTTLYVHTRHTRDSIILSCSRSEFLRDSIILSCSRLEFLRDSILVSWSFFLHYVVLIQVYMIKFTWLVSLIILTQTVKLLLNLCEEKLEHLWQVDLVFFFRYDKIKKSKYSSPKAPFFLVQLNVQLF